MPASHETTGTRTDCNTLMYKQLRPNWPSRNSAQLRASRPKPVPFGRDSARIVPKKDAGAHQHTAKRVRKLTQPPPAAMPPAINPARRVSSLFQENGVVARGGYLADDGGTGGTVPLE